MDRILIKQKRPIAITIICILGFIGTILLWGSILINFNIFFPYSGASVGANADRGGSTRAPLTGSPLQS